MQDGSYMEAHLLDVLFVEMLSKEEEHVEYVDLGQPPIYSDCFLLLNNETFLYKRRY